MLRKATSEALTLDVPISVVIAEPSSLPRRVREVEGERGGERRREKTGG